jgi:hypothetical protein
LFDAGAGSHTSAERSTQSGARTLFGHALPRNSVSRWLKRAADQGVIPRSGSGLRGDPFHYWLEGREPFFWPGDHASEADKQAWKDRWSAYMRDLIFPPKSA